MPTYSMHNLHTDEEFDLTIKYADLDEYFRQNPHIKQVFTKFPGVVDSVRIGVRKPDSSFKDVLHKAKSAHLHSTIEY